MKTNNQIFFEGTNGKAILLMHGLTSGAAQMIPMARFLNDYGYSVHCVNIAGHGTYPQDLLHTTAEDMICKAEYDYLKLKKEYEKIYVGGISTGGILSLMLCSKYPEIEGFISISSPIELVSNSIISTEYPEETVYVNRSMEGKIGIFKQYHIHYEKIAICIFDELRRLMEMVKCTELLNKINCPGLVVQADDDDIATPQSAVYILENINSPKKVSYTPSTGGHLIVLSEGRHEVFKQAAEFLENL
ncbi:MAG: alpha/beta hydrolase [Sedimentibacter sp.]